MTRKIDERRIVSTDSPGMRRVLQVIRKAAEPIDGRAIAEAAHISFKTFANTYRHLLIRADMIHVAGWRNNWRGPFVPLYLAGPAVAIAVPPPKVDHKIATRAWKERTGYYEAEKAKRRLSRPPDPALAALLGLSPRYAKTTTKGAAGAGKELAA